MWKNILSHFVYLLTLTNEEWQYTRTIKEPQIELKKIAKSTLNVYSDYLKTFMKEQRKGVTFSGRKFCDSIESTNKTARL